VKLLNKLKEDIIEAKERMEAWWDHEIIDRPCIGFWVPKEGKKIPKGDAILEFFDPWFLAKNWDNFDHAINEFEKISQTLEFGGENIPRFFPNYGPCVMAAIFGINPVYQSRTAWFHMKTSPAEIIPLLENVKINMNNPWYARLKKVTEFAAKRGNTDYCIAITDIGGVLDILSAFLGPTNIILTMKRNPEIINTCRAIILEKLLKVYDDLLAIILHYCKGVSSWMPLWSSKSWYPIQCDFSAMLNPKWFKNFVVPDIIKQAEHMEYAIYHLDGPLALEHLDTLLKIDSITGIQWVPGAGNEPCASDTWMPFYKKIQGAGKSIVIDLFDRPERLEHFYKILNPKYLITFNIFMDRARAYFFLPEFIGGKGGKGNYRKFKKEYRNAIKIKKNSNPS